MVEEHPRAVRSFVRPSKKDGQTHQQTRQGRQAGKKSPGRTDGPPGRKLISAVLHHSVSCVPCVPLCEGREGTSLPKKENDNAHTTRTMPLLHQHIRFLCLVRKSSSAADLLLL
mmetsp:Transcript_33505/g.106984  ORF Transcript_33505/g.106984 Transcript_33505/m.106984 type:complete len:114 (-) Transcript_33505:604-945(-)